MYPASQRYKDGIYATSRMNKGRITFDVSDVTAAGDVASISTTAENALSVKSQLVDKVRQPSNKLITHEQDRTMLDGSWTFAEEIAQETVVNWTSVVKGTVDLNKLFTKTDPTADWNAGARSVEAVTGNGGYVEYTVTDLNTYKSFGMTSAPAGGNFWGISYNIFQTVSATIEIYESGTSAGASFGSVVTGDKLRISVEGTTVKYSKNGVVFYMSPKPAVFPMWAEVSLHTINGTVSAPRLFPASQTNGEVGWASEQICDSTGRFIENKLTNGDFSNGLTGWVSSAATISAGGGVATLTAGAQHGDIDQHFVVTLGHKYYYRAKVKADSPFVTMLSGDYVTTAFAATFHSGSGQYEVLSVFLDVPMNAVPNNFFFGVRDSRTSGWTPVLVSEYMVVDLTEVYGAGNEPTKAWCDSNLSFVADGFPQFTFSFNGDHSSMGLTISFDPLNNEYATDFKMIAYDNVGTILASYTITGNKSAQYAANGQLSNYRKVGVQILKWSVPNRRARVSEVDFGIVRIFTGETGLVSMGLNEELDLTSGSLPSPEFKFTVDNSSREFNILNPTGFYKSLQQQQQVVGEIGLEHDDGSVSWIPIGNYLLWEWQSDEGSLTATFYARTKLDIMANVSYENLIPTPKTLYQLAVDIFTLCGVTNYSIDSTLQSVSTNCLIKKTNCKNVLQMIAMAGCANVFVTRDNVITIKTMSLSNPEVDTISLNDQYAEPRINVENAVKQVNMSYYTDVNTAVITTVTGSNTVGDTLKVEGNTLIDTLTRAITVANWVMGRKNARATYNANWRGNQAQEVGDVVTIGNSYGVDVKAYITRTELTYQGYVQATTEAKGVPN